MIYRIGLGVRIKIPLEQISRYFKIVTQNISQLSTNMIALSLGILILISINYTFLTIFS